MEKFNFDKTKFNTLYEGSDFKIILPIYSLDEYKKINKNKTELRNWGRDIFEKFLKGEIKDFEDIINLSR